MKDDTISRQAVLKLLSTIPEEEAITKAMLIQSVKQMDAAQPSGPDNLVKDSQGLVKDLVNDCISRKAAIDAFTDALNDVGALDAEDINTVLQMLPSAQPEQQWIPCSERLPEHGGRYLISVLDGINRRTTVAPYLPRCKAWTMTGRMAYWKVIAWMPLPEPYKEDDYD